MDIIYFLICCLIGFPLFAAVMKKFGYEVGFYVRLIDEEFWFFDGDDDDDGDDFDDFGPPSGPNRIHEWSKN